ncbi:YdbC family protein [Bacillus sp. DX4.1]|uniref:YdbC family protein n=1 Tax=Bacillus sp. DX4.1 TaxID=3055867 RepID=UPI0025A0BA65|nr:YdbC family protein [Bacillus sp. DX4.1]MDM5188696.1 YdbC family protein [Bacillus sp. DX4.1]
MILKSIFCHVEKEQKELFSTAQEKWRELTKLEGFHGQFGGWNEETACVFAAWENMNTYQQFMNETHDTIFYNSNQKDTYTLCETELYQSLFDMTETSFTEVIPNSSFARIAICDVKNGDDQQFLHVQETVWNIGMERSEGMLGGVVGRSLTKPNRYLVLSLWKDEESHRYYVEEIFPALYELANVSAYVSNVNGKQVTYVDEWSVCPAYF